MSMDFNLLTTQQKKVYLAITSYIKTKGIPPTVREIGEMMGEKTPGSVQGILNRLEQKGFIKREVGMARSIKLVSEDSNYSKPRFLPMLHRINSRNASNPVNVYNISKYLPFPEELSGICDGSFIISWKDDDHRKLGLAQGDLLILAPTEEWESGDIAIVFCDNKLTAGTCKIDSTDVIIALGNAAKDGDEISMKEHSNTMWRLGGKYTSYEKNR